MPYSWKVLTSVKSNLRCSATDASLGMTMPASATCTGSLARHSNSARYKGVLYRGHGCQIRRLFPGCPAGRAVVIAEHTGMRGSGRVGRSAAGRAFDEDAIVLAVVASVRHQDTRYDSLLMAGLSRDMARERVRPVIDRVLASWRTPAR